jgi:hypothetical protein
MRVRLGRLSRVAAAALPAAVLWLYCGFIFIQRRDGGITAHLMH